MKSRARAFTLIELMIAIAIIADLAVIALPSLSRARDQVQNTQFISGLRVATSAFEMYAAEHNKYPPNASPGIVPSGMAIYLGKMEWSGETPITGKWDWEPAAASPARLGVRFTVKGDDARMTEIDEKIDNGVLSTGAFRKSNNKLYLHIIE